MKYDEIDFVCKFTSMLSDREWCDFIATHQQVKVITSALTKKYECLYKDNIYGDSVHVIVYADGKPVATNAHLRNDLVPNIACYLSLHTYVSPYTRKMGMFSQMSKMCVEKVDDAYIYGYPNANSYPGLIKLGWKVVKSGVSSIFVGLKKSVAQEHAKLQAIGDDYVTWRYKPFNSSYRICRVKNVNLLLKVRDSKIGRLYFVVGHVNDVAALDFGLVNPPLLFSYIRGKRLLLVRDSENTIVENTVYRTLNVDIPIWRCDTI